IPERQQWPNTNQSERHSTTTRPGAVFVSSLATTGNRRAGPPSQDGTKASLQEIGQEPAKENSRRLRSAYCVKVTVAGPDVNGSVRADCRVRHREDPFAQARPAYPRDRPDPELPHQGTIGSDGVDIARPVTGLRTRQVSDSASEVNHPIGTYGRGRLLNEHIGAACRSAETAAVVDTELPLQSSVWISGIDTVAGTVDGSISAYRRRKKGA